MSNGEYYDEELQDESMTGFHEVEEDEDLFEDDDGQDFLKKNSLDLEGEDFGSLLDEDDELDLSEDSDFESTDY